MQKMYETFRTDPSLEKHGVTIDYGSFRVTVARAGGNNKRFAKILEQKTKPFRRAIQAGMMDRDALVALVRDAFVETSVLNWEVNSGTDNAPVWTQGIESMDGSILPFTKENVNTTFMNLPDLYDDIQEQAGKASLFRAVSLEEEAKN